MSYVGRRLEIIFSNMYTVPNGSKEAESVTKKRYVPQSTTDFTGHVHDFSSLS